VRYALPTLAGVTTVFPAPDYLAPLHGDLLWVAVASGVTLVVLRARRMKLAIKLAVKIKG
jgi:hypothetical protein